MFLSQLPATPSPQVMSGGGGPTESLDPLDSRGGRNLDGR